jgi:galactose mutarotase-like enzyme
MQDEPVGTRTFDDLYALDDDRQLALGGGGRRLALELGEGYGYAQVFTPPGAESVCLEPMTAPVNALVDGTCALVSPGTSFTARFSLRVEDEH